MPSTRRQISAIVRHCSSVQVPTAPASRARSANRRTAVLPCSSAVALSGSGAARERSRTTRSPVTSSASRLVASSFTDGHRPRICRGEVADVVEQVLAVVEHEQEAPDLQVLHDALGQRQPRALRASDRAGDDLDHELAVVGGGQLTEPGAVGEPWHDLGRDLHGEAGLAHAAGAGQGDERRLLDRGQRARRSPPRARRTT